jgi:hypothetical protein
VLNHYVHHKRLNVKLRPHLLFDLSFFFGGGGGWLVNLSDDHLSRSLYHLASFFNLLQDRRKES